MNSKNKYGNKKIVIDGEKFDSKKEGNRYLFLKSLLNAGKITELRLHPSFSISYGGTRDPLTGRMMAARKYVADFSYVDEHGVSTVEDVKSAITSKNSTYRLKRQLFLELYGKDCFFIET